MCYTLTQTAREVKVGEDAASSCPSAGGDKRDRQRSAETGGRELRSGLCEGGPALPA